MRIGPGLLETCPLPHAELVLLVDHHEAEFGEGHVFLDDRLRADHEVDLAGGDELQHGRALGGCQAAGQLGTANLAGRKHAFQR
jgi:hypothetical protein